MRLHRGQEVIFYRIIEEYRERFLITLRYIQNDRIIFVTEGSRGVSDKDFLL